MIRMVLTPIGLLAFTVFAHSAPVPKAGPTTADKVVGRWELVKSRGKPPHAPHFVVFTKDGTMTLEVGTGDSTAKYTGKYKVVGEAIDYELTLGDEKKSEKLDIKKLTDDEMHTTDPDGVEEEFKRIKEKDKDKDKDNEKKKDN